jgi:hypothetical protein
MGLWIRHPPLLEGELVRWTKPANRTQSNHRAVGGRLYLTGQRLLFQANRVDQITGGESWAVSLLDIASIGVEPGGIAGPFSGGLLRSRLRIELRSAINPELFVVGHLDEVMMTIQRAVAEAGT